MKTPSNNLHERKEPGQIINHVPRLLEEHGISIGVLAHEARLHLTTAYQWASVADPPTRFDHLTLIRICNFFDTPIEGIIEYVPNDN